MTVPGLDSLSVEQIAAMVVGVAPDLHVAEVAVLRQSPDWLLVDVNGEFVFRFTGSPAAREWLAAEHRLLRTVRGQISTPLPEPIRGSPDLGFDAHPRIDGDLLGARALAGMLSPEAWDRVAEGVGRFLAELHQAVDLATATRLGLPPPAYPLFEPDLLGRTLQLVASEPDRAVVRRVDQLLVTVMPRLRSPTLIHGDLHGDNVIVDPDGWLAGVIDFRTAAVADRHIDFRCLFGYGDIMEGAVDAYNARSPVPVDLRCCQVISAANDLYTMTWQAEQGVETVPIPARVAALRTRLQIRDLL